MWVKRYIENYHRPTYRNRAHSSDKHVNYNREALENRKKPRTLEAHTRPPFDHEKHVSFYVNVLNEGSVICAGALISHRMIITSTHCFYATGTDATYEYTAKKMTILTAIDFALDILFLLPESGGLNPVPLLWSFSPLALAHKHNDQLLWPVGSACRAAENTCLSVKLCAKCNIF